eukprot:213204-Prorocentrum_lima.AAC.1
MTEGQEPVLRYGAVRNDATKKAEQQFTLFLNNWASWVEDKAPKITSPDPDGRSRSWFIKESIELH